jgi:hypothetical protein
VVLIRIECSEESLENAADNIERKILGEGSSTTLSNDPYQSFFVDTLSVARDSGVMLGQGSSPFGSRVQANV